MERVELAVQLGGDTQGAVLVQSKPPQGRGVGDLAGRGFGALRLTAEHVRGCFERASVFGRAHDARDEETGG